MEQGQKNLIESFVPHTQLEALIQQRRTPNPAQFMPKAIEQGVLLQAIDVARYAPNHLKTEPARFYVCTADQKSALGALFSEIILQKAAEGAEQKAAMKQKVWSNVPALVAVTSYSPKASKTAQKRPQIHLEDYATVSTIIQNLTLLLFNQGIYTKWSTAAVIEHPDAYQILNTQAAPPDEQIVGFLLMGYLPEDIKLGIRQLMPFDEVVRS